MSIELTLAQFCEKYVPEVNIKEMTPQQTAEAVIQAITKASLGTSDVQFVDKNNDCFVLLSQKSKEKLESITRKNHQLNAIVRIQLWYLSRMRKKKQQKALFEDKLKRLVFHIQNLSDTYETIRKMPTPDMEQRFIDLLNHKQTFKSAANIFLIQEYFSGDMNGSSWDDATLEYMNKLMNWFKDIVPDIDAKDLPSLLRRGDNIGRLIEILFPTKQSTFQGQEFGIHKLVLFLEMIGASSHSLADFLLKPSCDYDQEYVLSLIQLFSKLEIMARENGWKGPRLQEEDSSIPDLDSDSDSEPLEIQKLIQQDEMSPVPPAVPSPTDKIRFEDMIPNQLETIAEESIHFKSPVRAMALKNRNDDAKKNLKLQMGAIILQEKHYLSQLTQISQWLDTMVSKNNEDLSMKQKIIQCIQEIHLIHETFLESLQSQMDKNWSFPFTELSHSIPKVYMEYTTLMFGTDGYFHQLSTVTEDIMSMLMIPIAQLSIYGSYIMDGTVHSLSKSRHWNFTRIKLHQLALSLNSFVNGK